MSLAVTATVLVKCAEPDAAVRLVASGDTVLIELRRGVGESLTVVVTLGELRRAVADLSALLAG